MIHARPRQVMRPPRCSHCDDCGNCVLTPGSQMVPDLMVDQMGQRKFDREKYSQISRYSKLPVGLVT